MNGKQVKPQSTHFEIEFRQLTVAKIGTILQTIKEKNNLTFKNGNCGQASLALRDRESTN